MTISPAASSSPLFLPFDGIEPRFGASPRLIGGGASLLGKVEVGARALIAAGAVLRGDGHFVRAGDDFCIGAHATVHIAQDIHPAIMGHRVTVGRNAVVHACTIGDDCVIGDNAVILDGSVLDSNVLIEADSTVFPKSKLAGGFIYAGTPAKPVRNLTPAEREERAGAMRQDAASAQAFTGGAAAILKAPEDVFIAKTASVSGRIELHNRSSVFFGCDFEAGEHEIIIGESTNIQDNTRIRCASAGTLIGRDVTVGHNVRLADCRVGARVLLGIGSTVAPGTIIEDDVMLAAGAVTLAGQTLESGWLWGGRPARPLARLDESKRAMMGVIIEHYRIYAEAYRRAQDRHSPAQHG